MFMKFLLKMFRGPVESWWMSYRHVGNIWAWEMSKSLSERLRNLGCCHRKVKWPHFSSIVFLQPPSAYQVKWSQWQLKAYHGASIEARCSLVEKTNIVKSVIAGCIRKTTHWLQGSTRWLVVPLHQRSVCFWTGSPGKSILYFEKHLTDWVPTTRHGWRCWMRSRALFRHGCRDCRPDFRKMVDR